MKKIFISLSLLCFVSLFSSLSQIPQTISWQGILQDAQGNNLNGVHTLTFALYDVATGGTPLWTEVQDVAVTNGLATVVLGEIFPLNLPFNKQYWLEIMIQGQSLSRVKLTSVPYAISSKNGGSGNIIQNDSLVFKDANGVARIIIDPNTGTFKMMNNDTVWYSISVNSPPEEAIINPDGTKTIRSGDGSEEKTYYSNGILKEEVYRITHENTSYRDRTSYDKDGNKMKHEKNSTTYGDNTITEKRTQEEFFNGKLIVVEEQEIVRDSKDPLIPILENKTVKKTYNEQGQVVSEIKDNYDLLNNAHSETFKKNIPTSEYMEYNKTPQNIKYKWSDDYALNQRTTTNQKGWIYELITPYQNNPHLIFINDGTGSKAFLQGDDISLGSNKTSTYKDFEVGNNLDVQKDIKAGGVKNFRIEHPADKTKYIQHASLESNEVLNVYSGNVTTNEKGLATVYLPDYFSLINIDFRYQLTVIGDFAQAIIFREIENNSFVIKTDKPNIKVSWQVTAKRNDAYIQNNGFKDVIDK